MHLRQAFVDDLQLDAPRRVGLEQIDVLPGDDAWRNPVEQRPHGERWHQALREAPDGAARADVDGQHAQDDVAVDRGGVELYVVDADDLAAMHVDDLLIQQITLEQQHAVRRRVSIPAGGVVGRADDRAARFERGRLEHALPVGSGDD